MDSVFLLGHEARSRFLHSAARSLDCAYICIWSYIPYPSNCLICSDGWFHEDHESRRLFDMYRASFCSIESGCVPGLAYKEGAPYIELADLKLMNLASTQIQRQFYQESGIKKVVFMGCKNGEIELGMSNMGNINKQMIRQFFSEDQFPTDHQSRPSSSSSSLPSPSVSSPENTSLLFTKAAAGEPSTQSMTKQAAYTRHQNIQFPTPASDDAALMRAMLTVISSSASSTSSLHVDQGGGQSRVVRPLRAFKPYNVALTQINSESRQILGGHRMIKLGIAIMRSINPMRSAEGRLQEPRPPPMNQLHHMISERKRREKLNESFHALRMLLPPGSKKDKASVLINTRDYLKTLKDQVSELEKRNRMLELQLLPDDHEIKEGGGDWNERIEIEITRPPESSSQVQRITLRITVRVECYMTDLLLRVLECLKERGGVNLLSVNANTFSPHTGVNARLNLSLQVQAGDWDERSFEEAVTRAVDSAVVAQPETTNRKTGD